MVVTTIFFIKIKKYKYSLKTFKLGTTVTLKNKLLFFDKTPQHLFDSFQTRAGADQLEFLRRIRNSAEHEKLRETRQDGSATGKRWINSNFKIKLKQKVQN